MNPNHHKLTRMSGAGNTFFILQGPLVAKADRPQFVQKICNNYVGFNTDGVLFLLDSTEADADWDFYNSDGSSAEMCGNAARCAGLFYFAKMKSKENILFNTAAGVIEASIVDANKGIVRVLMPQIIGKFGVQEVVVNKKKIKGFFVNTGVPHFVLLRTPDEELAKELRASTAFGSAGANITFTEFDSGDFIQAVTFERGVEDFTLACGTGAVAAAKYHHFLYPSVITQTVEMPGGLLQVEWTTDRPQLTGPAEFHFDLQLYED